MYAFDYQRPTTRDAAKGAASGADTHFTWPAARA